MKYLTHLYRIDKTDGEREEIPAVDRAAWLKTIAKHLDTSPAIVRSRLLAGERIETSFAIYHAVEEI